MQSLFTQLDLEWYRVVRHPAVAADLVEVCAIAGAPSPWISCQGSAPRAMPRPMRFALR